MGGEIIAEKFALVKTRGSNGVAFTHIVEDTLLGERAVVKVSDRFGPLAFEYLKTVNLAREADIPGVLMPFEGGILEEEAGFYFAFPEIGEPSLDNYLRAWSPLTCEEALGMILRLLAILEEMHRAGFVHLFIGTRNVFYRPRGEVTLKDPALKPEFFHPLLEAVDSPDFSYFSPGVMDGEEPGPQADLYALGRLAERLLEGCCDAATSPAAEALRWAGERLRRCCAGEAASPAAFAAEIADMIAASRSDPDAVPREGAESRSGDLSGGALPGDARKGGFARKRGRAGRRSGMLTALTCALLLALLAGSSFLAGIGGRKGQPARAGAAGGADAGALVEEAAPAKKALRGEPQSAGVIPASLDAQGGAELSGDVSASCGDAAGGGARGAAEKPGEDAGRGDAAAGQPAAPTTGSPAAPVASFTLTPGEGQSPLQVYLDASASYDPDGAIVSYSWSFGGSGRSAYHVFESNVIPATVPVTLTVTDDGGHSASAIRFVTLY